MLRGKAPRAILAEAIAESVCPTPVARLEEFVTVELAPSILELPILLDVRSDPLWGRLIDSGGRRG